MRIKQRVLTSMPHDNLDRGPTKQAFEFVKTGTIVQITHHHQRRAFGQMFFNPRAHPDRLRQLLAPVCDADTHHFGGRGRTMRGFGF